MLRAGAGRTLARSAAHAGRSAHAAGTRPATTYIAMWEYAGVKLHWSGARRLPPLRLRRGGARL
eukprot:2070874-Prymnesium_polylepis.2